MSGGIVGSGTLWKLIASATIGVQSDFTLDGSATDPDTVAMYLILFSVKMDASSTLDMIIDGVTESGYEYETILNTGGSVSGVAVAGDSSVQLATPSGQNIEVYAQISWLGKASQGVSTRSMFHAVIFEEEGGDANVQSVITGGRLLGDVNGKFKFSQSTGDMEIGEARLYALII